MKSVQLIKTFIAEQYVDLMYFHVPINRPSNFYGPVRNSHVAVSNISGYVNNNQVAVVSDMGQKLIVDVGTSIAVSQIQSKD